MQNQLKKKKIDITSHINIRITSLHIHVYNSTIGIEKLNMVVLLYQIFFLFSSAQFGTFTYMNKDKTKFSEHKHKSK